MTYRIYKANGSKCIRKFESLDEAKEWCWLTETGNYYRIEWQYEDEASPRRMYI